MSATFSAQAVVFEGPRRIGRRTLGLSARGPADVLVRTLYSGISTGTERLFYTGDMPEFPGMGYPLVPGYETVGEVLEAAPGSGIREGDRVFVPGANCFGEVRGLFGGAASMLVTAAHRVRTIPAELEQEGVLFALAATAHHAVRAGGAGLPDLIIGHGALGRLLARITAACGGRPRVWETNPDRRAGALGYPVVAPEEDAGRRFGVIVDASGHGASLERWVTHLAPRGEIVLAGFYTQPLQFNFVPAFLREARLRVAAQWLPHDLDAVRAMVSGGLLSLQGIVTSRSSADEPARAYAQAFEDPTCLKMVLDWRQLQ